MATYPTLTARSTKPPGRPPARRRRRIRVDLVAAMLFAVLHLLNYSTLSQAVSEDFFRLTLAGMALMIAFGIVRAVIAGRWLGALGSIALLGLIFTQIAVFAQLANYPINWNVAFSYLPLAGFVLFTNLDAEDYERMLSGLFVICLTYCILYIPLALGLVVLPGARQLFADYRGARIILSAAHAAYCLFYAVAMLRRRRASATWLLWCLIAALAIYLSLSRGFILLVALVLMTILVTGTGRTVRLGLVLGFAVAVAVALAGTVLPDWNPFSALSSDASASARAASYDALRPLVIDHWLLGIGLPSTNGDFTSFVQQYGVFWQDLGPFGVWASFGFVGLVAYLGISWFCILGVRPPAGVDPARFAAVSWTCLVVGLSSVYSPDAWSGSGVVAVGLLIAGAGLARRRHETAPRGRVAVNTSAQIRGTLPVTDEGRRIHRLLTLVAARRHDLH